MMSLGVNWDGITSEIKAVLLVDFINKNWEKPLQ